MTIPYRVRKSEGSSSKSSLDSINCSALIWDCDGILKVLVCFGCCILFRVKSSSSTLCWLSLLFRRLCPRNWMTFILFSPLNGLSWDALTGSLSCFSFYSFCCIFCCYYFSDSLLPLVVGLFIYSFSTSSITELNRFSVCRYKFGMIGFSMLRLFWKWALLFSSYFCLLWSMIENLSSCYLMLELWLIFLWGIFNDDSPGFWSS